MNAVPARHVSARDAEIGSILKQQRIARGLSQSDLGNAVGVTFQQVQKYENGKNRISSGRLQRIAEVLDIPVAEFFAQQFTARTKTREPSPIDLAHMEGATRLLQAFQKIDDRTARQAIIAIATFLSR